MIRVEVYGKRDCCLCDEVKATLSKVRLEIPFARSVNKVEKEGGEPWRNF